MQTLKAFASGVVNCFQISIFAYHKQFPAGNKGK